MVVAGRQGDRVFTLQGAEHAYRVLIESMNEGALTLTADKTILYANQCFARMVKCPLEQVMGSSFRRFLSAEDRAALRTAPETARQVRLQNPGAAEGGRRFANAGANLHPSAGEKWLQARAQSAWW